MPDIEVYGKTVTVGDNFNDLSPDDQQKTVNEIAATIRNADMQKTKSADDGWAPRGNAFAAGVLSGIPLVGPSLEKGAQYLSAVGDSYQNGLPVDHNYKYRRGETEKNIENHPNYHTAGEIVGGVAGTAPLVVAAPAAFGGGTAALGVRMLAGGGTSGALSGADSYLRNGDVKQAAKDAVLGAAVGAGGVAIGNVVGKAAGKVSNWINPAAPVRTAEELEQAASQAYKRADAAGVVFKPSSLKQAASGIESGMVGEGYNASIGKSGLYPGAVATMENVKREAANPLRLSDVELLRRQAGIAAGDYSEAKGRFGMQIKSGISDFLNNAKPSDVRAGNVKAGVDALNEARPLWQAKSKAELIGEALMRAEGRASTSGSGGNVNNTIRQEVRKLLPEFNKSSPTNWTADELTQMRKISKGGAVDNVLRLLGGLSPTTGRLNAMIAAGGTVHSPEITLPLMAVGAVAKGAADRVTRARLMTLDEIIRNMGRVSDGPNAPAARARAAALARLLMASPQHPVAKAAVSNLPEHSAFDIFEGN